MSGRENRYLVIMVKRASLGRVKTRLAADIGPAHATRFYRHASAQLACRLGSDPRWTTVLAVSPVAAVVDAVWPTGLACLAQGRGDLGQRMQRVVDGLPSGPVVMIGSDCPMLSTDLIARAFRALGNHDAVVCPAPDGGYGLIGLRRCPKIPDTFRNVRWSSAFALRDTLQNLQGTRVATLDEVVDVDHGAEYAHLGHAIGRLILPK